MHIGARAKISTEGSDSYAVYGTIAGTVLTLGSDAEIETSGANSDAVVANNGASVTIGANVRITTRGAGASGAYSGVGSSASGAVSDSLLTIMDGAAIETFGDNADAALARAASGRKAALVLGDRAELATSGIGAYGLAAYYDGASASAGDGLKVSTGGSEAFALAAISGGRVEVGENAELKTGGSNAFAAAVYYEGSALDIGVGATIETMGRNAKGLAAVDGGSISAGSGLNIVTFGEHSVGIFSNSSATVLTGQTDEERRAELDAIESSDGVASIRVGEGARITTSGDRAYGAYAYYQDSYGKKADNLIVIGDGASISTSGEYAMGVMAYTASAVGSSRTAVIEIGRNVSIVTTGANSSGIETWYSGAKVTAGDGLYVKVGNSTGVMAYYGSEIELKGSTIISGYRAVYAGNGLDGGTLSKVVARGVHHIEGFISAGSYGLVDMTYMDGSYFRGYSVCSANGVVNFDMTGTRWILTENSKLVSISLKGGSVMEQTISGRDSVTTLWADSFLISDSTIKVILDDYEAVLGDTFQLVASDSISISGSFSFDFSLAELADGLFWDTGKFAEYGYIFVSDTAPIPEPAFFAAILGLAALATGAFRRRMAGKFERV